MIAYKIDNVSSFPIFNTVKETLDAAIQKCKLHDLDFVEIEIISYTATNDSSLFEIKSHMKYMYVKGGA